MAPPQPRAGIFTPGGIALLVAAIALGAAMPESLKLSLFTLPVFITMLFNGEMVSAASLDAASLPAQAQLMLPETTVVLPVVPPPSVANATTVSINDVNGRGTWFRSNRWASYLYHRI
jgi:hypothetical protein